MTTKTMFISITAAFFTLALTLFAQDIPTLFDAIRANDLAAAKTLLANGADINARDADGNTALILACGKDASLATIEFLIKNGADIYAANKEEKLAYDVAHCFSSKKQVY